MKFDKNTLNLSGMVYGDQNPLDLGLRVLILSGECNSQSYGKYNTKKFVLTKEGAKAFKEYLSGDSEVTISPVLESEFHTWYRNNLDDVRLFASFWCLDSQGYDFCYYRTQIN